MRSQSVVIASIICPKNRSFCMPELLETISTISSRNFSCLLCLDAEMTQIWSFYIRKAFFFPVKKSLTSISLKAPRKTFAYPLNDGLKAVFCCLTELTTCVRESIYRDNWLIRIHWPHKEGIFLNSASASVIWETHREEKELAFVPCVCSWFYLYEI